MIIAIISIFWSVILAPAAAVTTPVQVKEPDVCYVCHAEIQELGSRKHQHTAFAKGVCSACHNPHAARHNALLNDDVKSLCLSCHDDVKGKMGLASVHQPARDGDCLICHDPHASQLPKQLKHNAPALCEGCHPASAEWRKRSHVHQPVAAGNCLTCHEPHGSSHGPLLTKAMPELCFTCHKQDAPLAAAHKGFSLVKADCGACHDPHATSLPGLLMPNQHAPFKAGKCTACHVSSAAAGEYALTADVKTVCLKCHQNILGSKAYQHNLNDPRSCLNCHNAHTSSADALLSAPQKDLCLRCHFGGDKYKGRKKEDYLTHNGLECANCHTPHGSDNPQYLKSQGEDICIGCHTDAHKGSHPLGPNVIDPRTNTPVTCLSCHKLHGADFKPYLPLNPAMELCIQCHRR